MEKKKYIDKINQIEYNTYYVNTTLIAERGR